MQIETLRRTKQHNILTKQELEVLENIVKLNRVYVINIAVYLNFSWTF